MGAGTGEVDPIDVARVSGGRVRMRTGWDARPGWLPAGLRGDPWFREFARKCVTIAAGEAFPLAEIEGAGVVTRLFVAVPVRQQRHLLRKLVLRAWWDGEAEPSVLVPLGDFFGAAFARYRMFDSRILALCSGGYVSTFPMPFARGARIEVVNESARPVHLFFWGVTWRELEEVPDVGRFHACFRRSGAEAVGEPHVVAELEGRGHYVGTFLQTQNLDRPWGWPPQRTSLPRGFGLGNLEGWEEITIDGESEPSFHGTGTEEYFNTGWYFLRARDAGWNQGVLGRSYLTGRAAAYRYHVDDPIPFERSLRFVMRRGLFDGVRADYASVAYWYQHEPHRPWTLPPVDARLPASPWPHVAWMVAPGVGALAAARWLLGA